ncbi:C-type lectin domain family 2 member D-like [Psammomys obesus]|uniref:C-type lectin domain family 2 member D-like n=1 Tax=Psammomys obesus TaxID=48139 RepID=UPI0024530B26|nr:C-type lectin domain family 2 member D-like [Psammomys obesus]
MSEEIKLTNSGDFQSSESQEFQTRSKRRLYIPEVTSFVFLLVILALAATLAVEKQKIPTYPPPCLDDWIGYQRKCFYFSENTTTWGASQNFCASHTATLAVFNTTKELDFLKRYTDHSHYWIGLSREQGAEWQWADGSVYSSRLKISGRGQYAYLHKSGISSASSHLLKKWICSRPDAPRN